MTENQPVCLYCQQNSEQVPLMPVLYKGNQVHICPQHLPILIHKPAQLADKLPGAENLAAGNHD